MTKALTRQVAVSMLLIGLIIGFSIWWLGVMRERIYRTTTPTLVAVAKPIDPVAARTLADTLLGAIVRKPLDQTLVNGFYTVATVNRLAAPATLAEWRRQLGRLGWRSTPAQQNLLFDAANAQDLPTILDRTDGLMRRRQLVEQVSGLLYLIEQAPETHRMLLDRLEHQVPWRTVFFSDPRGVATPGGLQARYVTIQQMLNDGHAVTRAEVAPLLTAMVAAKHEDAAFRMWGRYRRQDGHARVLASGETFDPDFAIYRGVKALPLAKDLPFEWQPASGDGYSTDIGRDGVTLHWDGTGVPVLLRQLFHAVPGRYELVMRGTDATPDFLNRFEVVATCPSNETLFTVMREGTVGRFVVGSDGTVSCSFPTLLIRARASMVPQTIDASLTSLALHPSRS